MAAAHAQSSVAERSCDKCGSRAEFLSDDHSVLHRPTRLCKPCLLVEITPDGKAARPKPAKETLSQQVAAIREARERERAGLLVRITDNYHKTMRMAILSAAQAGLKQSHLAILPEHASLAHGIRGMFYADDEITECVTLATCHEHGRAFIKFTFKDE